MKLTPQQYAELIARRPNLVRSQAQADDEGIRPTEPEQVKRPALVKRVSRKAESVHRLKILFTIYSVRPLDWDNYHVKSMQDLLIKSGIIPGDKWSELRGEVVSEKVDRKEEERTEITIT